MTTKLLTLFACFMLAAINSFSQQFEVPANVVMDKKEDYANYDKDVIAAVNWLEATPIGTDADKRKSVNAFVMKWINGSPEVTIGITESQIKLFDKNPDFLLVFMGAYSRYVLQTKDASVLPCYVAAMKSVIAVYKLGGKIKKSKQLTQASEANDGGKLEDWIKTNMGGN